MGWVSFVVFGFAFGVIATLLGVVEIPVPYPGFQHSLQDIDPDHLIHGPSPLAGVYSPNTALQSAKKVLEGTARGVETIAISQDGDTAYLPDKFGNVLQAKVVEDGKGGVDLMMDPLQPLLAYLGAGRPMGVHVDGNGDLVVCDSAKGLIKVEVESKRVEILSNIVSESSPKQPGTPINYANDLDIGKDGVVYFSDSTVIPVALGRGGWYDTLATYILTVVHGKATGRLLSYNPETRETVVLLSGVWFANGVALSQDESFVVVAETPTFMIYKYFLKGLKAGQKEVLIDNLPGHPDGVTRASDGSFWVSIVSPPSPIQKLIPYRAFRVVIGYLPAYLRPKIGSWGCVLKIDPKGKVVEKLMDPDGGFITSVSAAQEHGGRLYLGNLVGDYVSIFDLGLLRQD